MTIGAQIDDQVTRHKGRDGQGGVGFGVSSGRVARSVSVKAGQYVQRVDGRAAVVTGGFKRFAFRIGQDHCQFARLCDLG